MFLLSRRVKTHLSTRGWWWSELKGALIDTRLVPALNAQFQAFAEKMSVQMKRWM